MLHKLSLRTLLVENVDVDPTRLLAYQGHVTEIFALLFLFRPGLVEASFLPSVVYTSTKTKLKMTPEALKDPKKLQAFKNAISPVGLSTLTDTIDDGTWLPKLKEIYKKLYIPTAEDAYDKLFGKYLRAARQLSNYIRKYIDGRNSEVTSAEWTGVKGKMGGTGDVILYTPEYLNGIHISLKTSIQEGVISNSTETQALGLYEKEGIDLSLSAQNAVGVLLDEVRRERQSFLDRHVRQFESKAGIFALPSEKILEIEDKYTARLVEIRKSLTKLGPQITEIEKAVKPKVSTRASLLRKRREAMNDGYYDGGFDDQIDNLQPEIDALNARKKPLKREKKKLEKEIEKIPEKKAKELTKERERHRDRIWKETIQEAGWSLVKRPVKSRPFEMVAQIPSIDAAGNLPYPFGLRQKDTVEISKISEMEVRNSVWNEMSDKDRVNTLLTKFIERSEIGQKAAAATSLHLIITSWKGIVPKSDYEFLKEFMKLDSLTTFTKQGIRNSIRICSRDPSGTEWQLLSISVGLFKRTIEGARVPWLGRPILNTTPMIKNISKR